MLWTQFDLEFRLPAAVNNLEMRPQCWRTYSISFTAQAGPPRILKTLRGVLKVTLPTPLFAHLAQAQPSGFKSWKGVWNIPARAFFLKNTQTFSTSVFCKTDTNFIHRVGQNCDLPSPTNVQQAMTKHSTQPVQVCRKRGSECIFERT